MSELLLSRWTEEYLAKERGYRPNTVRTYSNVAKHLTVWTGKPLWEITTQDARTFLRESTDAASYKMVCIAALKSFNKFYCLETDTPMNGIQALSGPRIRSERGRVLSLEEVWLLLEGARTAAEKRLVNLGLYAGTRITEAMRFVEGQLGIVEWSDGRLVVMGKGYKLGKLPLHPKLEEMSIAIRTLEPTAGQLRYAAEQLRERLQVEFTAHDLRRTFSERLEEASVPHNVKQDLMRHAGDITTERYSGVSWKAKVAGIDSLSYV